MKKLAAICLSLLALTVFSCQDPSEDIYSDTTTSVNDDFDSEGSSRDFDSEETQSGDFDTEKSKGADFDSEGS